jgi:predicted GIY-YIG superfamily endonuclease
MSTPRLCGTNSDIEERKNSAAAGRRRELGRLTKLVGILLIAVQCFVSTVEEAFKEQAMFKEWARSWVKRKLIENAIEIISPASARNGQKRDLWGAGQQETQRECEIDTVTKLEAFESFVFVMSILERYSNWDCSLLLECSMNKVAQARMKALRRLPNLAAPFPRAMGCHWVV